MKENKKTKNAVADVDFALSLPQEQLTGQVLVTMQGFPVITVDSLQQEKQDLFIWNPQLKMIVDDMGITDKKKFEHNFVSGLVNQIIIDKNVVDTGITNKKEYQTELKEFIKKVQRMINTKYFDDAQTKNVYNKNKNQIKEYQTKLNKSVRNVQRTINSKYFSKKFHATVTDCEVKKFYDDNKDLMPDILISHGGTKAMGVLFDNKKDAQNFKIKVLAKKGDIRSAAKDMDIANKRVRNFKLIHEDNIEIEHTLKEAIVGVKTVPMVVIVALGNNNFWVVSCTERKEPKHRPFDQVQDKIIRYIKQEKRAEMLNKEIECLKIKYDVIIDEDYFIHK